MKQFCVLAIFLLLVGCSNDDNSTPKGATEAGGIDQEPKTTKQASDETARKDRVRLHETQMKDYAQAHDAIPAEIGRWSSGFTADLQNRVLGKVIAVQGHIIDLEKKENELWEMTVGRGSFLRASTLSVHVTREQVGPILKDLKRNDSIYVTTIVTKVTPIHLSARVCRESDCDEVEIAERRFGKKYRIDGDLIHVEGSP